MAKTIEFKNEELAAIANFLGDLKLKNKPSRGRSKLIKLLASKNQEYLDERDEERMPYFKKDENGNPVVEDNKYVLEDESKKQELDKILKDIAAEKAVIDLTEHTEKIEALYRALENYEEVMTGEDALIYDTLLDQLENIFEGEDE